MKTLFQEYCLSVINNYLECLNKIFNYVHGSLEKWGYPIKIIFLFNKNKKYQNYFYFNKIILK